ncbi:hypothetical protein HMPREF9720_2188 [Alistipes sp. HGB5]|nr:hypothetical protein HMPREF9720_2188 [Alistipes sp. HGB5]
MTFIFYFYYLLILNKDIRIEIIAVDTVHKFSRNFSLNILSSSFTFIFTVII